jgi:hypothetical protein
MNYSTTKHLDTIAWILRNPQQQSRLLYWKHANSTIRVQLSKLDYASEEIVLYDGAALQATAAFKQFTALSDANSFPPTIHGRNNIKKDI